MNGSLRIAIRVVAAAALLGILSPFPAFAGGYATLDIGSQRAGMQATVAKGSDLTTIYSNPGGLADLKGTRFYFSATPTYIHARFRMLLDTGEYSESISPTRSVGVVPFLGASWDFGSENWVFGLAWYFPNLSASALPEDAPTKYQGVEAYFVNWYLTPTLSYNLTDKISVGVGLSHLYALQYIRTRVNLQRILPFLTGDGELEAWPRDTGFVWNSGFMFGPFDGWKIGASYSSREWLDMGGDLRAESLNPNLPLKIKGHYQSKIPIPESIRLGLNYTLNSKWQFGLDWTWWHYNIYHKNHIYLTGNSLLEAISPLRTTKMYGNSWNIALGAEYMIRPDWSWMLGTSHDETPIPDKTFGVDNPTSDNWSATTGTWFRIGKHWDCGISYVSQWQMPRDVTNSITNPPTNVKSTALTQKIALSFSYASKP